jgi:ribonuclease BN (tRNA processing enzyme)
VADVFLSYAREDRQRVKPLASELAARGYDVWWDHHLTAGENWARKIKAQLDVAKCVVVVWTRNSVDEGRSYKSEWVENEAHEGHMRGVLVPALLDSGCVAWEHQKVHYASMEGWLGETNARGLTELFEGIAQHVQPCTVDDGEDETVGNLHRDDPAAQEITVAEIVATDATADAANASTAESQPVALVSSLVHDESPIDENELFAPNALRAVVCGVSSGPLSNSVTKPCLAVIAAGRMFIIDAGAGAAISLESHRVPLSKLEAVLLTGAEPVRASDLNELCVDYAIANPDGVLPIYGPMASHDVVRDVNATLAAQKMRPGLQPWAPAPEPGKPVIVFEGDGLTVLAFTTESDAHTGRVGYRFDYRGRSLVVAGDGRAEWINATKDADVVLHGAQSQGLAQLHDENNSATPFEVASAARASGAGMLVLTGVEYSPVQQEGDTESGMVVELPISSQEVRTHALKLRRSDHFFPADDRRLAIPFATARRET